MSKRKFQSRLAWTPSHCCSSYPDWTGGQWPHQKAPGGTKLPASPGDRPRPCPGVDWWPGPGRWRSSPGCLPPSCWGPGGLGWSWSCPRLQRRPCSALSRISCSEHTTRSSKYDTCNSVIWCGSGKVKIPVVKNWELQQTNPLDQRTRNTCACDLMSLSIFPICRPQTDHLWHQQKWSKALRLNQLWSSFGMPLHWLQSLYLVLSSIFSTWNRDSKYF